MKTIIAGSRSLHDYRLIERAVKSSAFPITEIVHGAAPGIDSLAETYAFNAGLPVVRFRADWEAHGNQAGPIRNVQMAKYADALIAIWDGESPGTRHMIQAAKNEGLEIFVLRTDAHENQPELFQQPP